jgi:hypothetical protein
VIDYLRRGDHVVVERVAALRTLIAPPQVQVEARCVDPRRLLSAGRAVGAARARPSVVARARVRVLAGCAGLL